MLITRITPIVMVSLFFSMSASAHESVDAASGFISGLLHPSLWLGSCGRYGRCWLMGRFPGAAGHLGVTCRFSAGHGFGWSDGRSGCTCAGH